MATVWLLCYHSCNLLLKFNPFFVLELSLITNYTSAENKLLSKPIQLGLLSQILPNL